MKNGSLEKTCKVIVIDPASAVRQILNDVLRGLGQQNVQGLASLQDALNLLAMEDADWIITPLFANEPVNALHLLKIFTENQHLRKVRLSLLLEENETYCLPAAFELGLFTWHKRPFTKTSLQADFEAMFAVLEKNTNNMTLTAAHYLREVLQTQKRYNELLDLEDNLVKFFPGQTELLLKLGEALILAGQKDQGRNTLMQLRSIDEKFTESVQAVLTKHLTPEELAATQASPMVNVLGLETCLIVDPDESIRRTVQEILTQIGVKTVIPFEDGKSAFEWIEKNPEPSLIIHEWRIPKIPGPLLIQKIREKGYITVPLIVLSSLLKAEDIPLVKEMGVANTIAKPIDKETVTKALLWTIQQDRVPTEPKTMERKIRQLLETGKLKEAEALHAQFNKNSTATKAAKLQLRAEILYYKKQYEQAKATGIEVVKLGGDSLAVMNLLGKALMKLRDFDSALRCLEKARTLSPQNIERLCAIAEAQSETGTPEQAQAAIDAAKAIDPDSKAVKDTEVKCAMTKGDVNNARKLMSQLGSLDAIVSFLNNRAVALARTQKIEDGMNVYLQALEAIPMDRGPTRAIIYYNFALACVRDGDLAGSLAHFDNGKKSTQDPRLIKKIDSLKSRVQKALKTGEPLILRSSQDQAKDAAEQPPPDADAPPPAAASPAANAAKVAPPVEEPKEDVVEPQRGEICCYLMFYEATKRDPKVAALLQKLPEFKRRKAIERSEAMGADRMLKKAN